MVTWLLLCMPHQRNIPHTIYSPPYNLGDEMDDWKPHHSSQPGGTKDVIPLGGAMRLSPEMSEELPFVDLIKLSQLSPFSSVNI